ncbi:ribonuclease H-like domain-containing protein [Tanacetum coccineum]|uniref:Ribonuclease H-like domain-containing protein n=1 Tax=Tanacetum coccineum TaxID=301880 RepID=A0ABQ5CVR1_9ASTR
MIKPGTSSSNTQKHKVHQKVQQTNIPVIPSTGVNTSTEASGSKTRSNTKHDRIMPAKSANKKKVEDHPKTNKSVWTKVNRVDSSISSKRVVINSNSESVLQRSIQFTSGPSSGIRALRNFEFGGNDESKKMQKYILKQQFKGFNVSNTDGIHKGYEKFQSLLSQLEIHRAGVSTEDANQKFLRSSYYSGSVTSFCSTASSSNLQNVAFVSENTNSTNDVSTAYGVSNTSDQVDEYDLEEMDLKWQVAMISMRIKKFYKKTGRKLQFDAKEPVGFDKTKVECYNCHKTGHFARECRTKEDNRRRDGWNPGNKDGSRTGKKEESKALVTVDGESVDWTTHSEDDENYAFMASNSSGSDTQVTSCSNECKESYANLKRLYDAQREQLSDASVEIKAYTQGLKKVEAQLVAHQQGQLWYEQKIKFMKIDLDDKTDVLTYHKKLLAKAQKEKDDLEVIVDKWNHSSKNLGKIVNYPMSASDKFGLGYGDYRYSGILSYENEVLQSVFKGNKSDFENLPLHKRLGKTCEMQAVPPPMTGNYLPSGPDIEIDDSQYTYGPEKTQPSESESQTTELDTCDSNISTEPSELVSEPVVNESNIEVQPKVWSDAPIIEEYESDSDDEYVSVQTKGLDTPSFANKQVKTPRENVKNQSTHSQKPKVNNKELGHGFTERACFGNGTGERKPTWNNAQRVNKQNQFVPLAVQTRTGNNPVNTAKASSTNNFSTARQNVNKQTVLTSTALKVNTVKPIVNGVRPANVFHKTHSPPQGFQKEHSTEEQNFQTKKFILLRICKEDESDQDCFELPIWHSYSSTNSSASKSDNKRGGPREEEQVFLDDLARLQRQEKEANEEAEALRKNLEQETENLDIHEDTTDGIFTHSSYDDEGAEADFTNLETVVNVSPIPTSRINPSHPSALILGDPTSAVQTRSILNKVQKLMLFNPRRFSEALKKMKAGLWLCKEELLQFEMSKIFGS